MQGTITIQASDVEPGAVIVTVTPNDGGIFILRGHDLERFAHAFGAAMMTAFADIMLTELNSREAEDGQARQAKGC